MKAKRRFTVIIERDEDGWYVATVPVLRVCHTQAKKLDTLMKRVGEAIELCAEDGKKLEPPKRQRRRQVLLEAKKLKPDEERALAEEGMRGEGSAGGRNEWLESLTRPRN